MRLSLKVRMTKWKNFRTVKTALYFWNCCNCSKIGRNILKNLEFLSFGILIVQICSKIPGLLRFKFSKLTYRKKDWQVPTSSMRPFCSVSDPMFTCKARAPLGFCLIRHSILIGSFNTVLSHFLPLRKKQYLEINSLCSLYFFEKKWQ